MPSITRLNLNFGVRKWGNGNGEDNIALPLIAFSVSTSSRQAVSV